MVVCIALGVDVFRGDPCPPLYIRRDRVTWKVLAEYSWSPTTTRSGSFLVLQLVSTSIRVVTKEVRYIHELFLTQEHSMPISSPAAPGLTVPAIPESPKLVEMIRNKSYNYFWCLKVMKSCRS